jgi:N-acetylmannosamine-6-phosphate 2-epimerase/N-acetylmannosamine kinase
MKRPPRGLIVSCQPVPGGPFDTVAGVVAFARAAAAAGACGLRIEGAENVAAVTRAVALPVIGLIKRDLADSAVRITPLIEDVAALDAAGAHIIAVDATARRRPVAVAALLAAIRAAGRGAMADCATPADARAALAAGADMLGSTLSGYTGGPVPPGPDLALVRALSGLGAPVLAEGRYNTPALAAAAIRAGADAVVVGSAITRPEHVTGWFADAIAAAAPAPVLAFDIGGSKTLAALVRDGVVLDRRQIATDRDVADPGWVRRVAALARDWQGAAGRAAIAATGLVRDGAWSAVNPDVLAIPPGFPLASRLADALGLPVLAVNDAQAAAWGEHRFGAAKGLDLLFVTVSSGIGGGIVRGGRLLTGDRGLAGSLGQLPVGGGTLEQVASGFGVTRRARALGHDIDMPGLFARGAPWSERLLDEAARALADALVGAQALLDPPLVALGGGVGLAEGFLGRVTAACAGHSRLVTPRLVAAGLRGDAGIVGAAGLDPSDLAN